MIKKYFFALTLLTLTLTQANAQSSKNRKDSTVVVIFNQNDDEDSPKKKKTGESNVIKIAPLGFISGTYPLYFERRITDYFTVQVGGGVTGRDFLRNAIQGGEDGVGNIKITYPEGFDESSDYTAGKFNFDNRKSGLGYLFSIQPRLYFDSEAPDGSFLAVSYDYYHYVTSIPGLVMDNNEPVHGGADQSEFENLNDIMVHFGSQSVYDRLTFEYTTGIGLRNVNGTKYVAGYSNGSVINEGFATYKQNIFNFSVGLKVGYHF